MRGTMYLRLGGPPGKCETMPPGELFTDFLAQKTRSWYSQWGLLGALLGNRTITVYGAVSNV